VTSSFNWKCWRLSA